MNRKVISAFLAISVISSSFIGCSRSNDTAEEDNSSNITEKSTALDFNQDTYEEQSYTVDGQEVKFRAYENIVYVENPVDETYQSINIYIPTAYFEDGTIGEYTADSAPIFLPNQVGGYLPAEPGTPSMEGAVQGEASRIGMTSNSEESAEESPNAILYALSKGYVVASPGARGRTNETEDGIYYGKAPAAIVDLKAAVRYLHYNDDAMPGDAGKIISNGTSAGGALSALLGASGNSSDYDTNLTELGAADASDDIYAVSSYCPITNLNHADMAYEWLFNGYNDYVKTNVSVVDGEVKREQENKTLTEGQKDYSKELKAAFPEYVNSLNLKDLEGNTLTLDANGNGSFKDYVKAYIITSAQTALEEGVDLSEYTWITINDNKVNDIDMDGYTEFLGRSKPAPAFDSVDLQEPNPENSLFGTDTVDNKHFTKFSSDNDTTGGTMADENIINIMNVMNYIGNKDCETAKYWRIRHGAKDSDTALAIPTIMANTLESDGEVVDYAIPWGEGHGGDYDLDELFTWIDGISK